MISPDAVQSSIDPSDFEPFPIANVTVGDPDGRVHWLRKTGADGQILAAGVFTALPSSYPYQFPGDETSHILAGHATVTMDDGTVVELRPGVIVSFLKGAHSTWVVHEPFRKFFVVSA